MLLICPGVSPELATLDVRGLNINHHAMVPPDTRAFFYFIVILTHSKVHHDLFGESLELMTLRLRSVGVTHYGHGPRNTRAVVRESSMLLSCGLHSTSFTD